MSGVCLGAFLPCQLGVGRWHRYPSTAGGEKKEGYAEHACSCLESSSVLWHSLRSQQVMGSQVVQQGQEVHCVWPEVKTGPHLQAMYTHTLIMFSNSG